MPLLPILTIDLTTGDIGSFDVPDDWQEQFLGGASLAARILYDELTSELDPLSPEAPLLFLNGPLTGTSGPAVGRFVVAAKSPATGLWGESNVGGFWGPGLRKAGFDGILIHGASPEPVYLWLDDGEVELRSAEAYWGLDTYASRDAILAEVDKPGARAATIGPAGENLIPFALILCDHGRVAGRTGMGAVMGSKKLKAIAVKGTGKVPVADFSAFNEVRSSANRALAKDTFTEVMRSLGSSGAAEYFDYLGEMPKQNFSRGVMEGVERMTGAAMAETILVGQSACHACVIACGRVIQIGDGKEHKGPEYETMMGFGPNLMIDDLEAAAHLGELCDRFGLDSISASGTLGLAIELFELGIITTEDTDGLELSWNNPEQAAELLQLTAATEGFGSALAEGSRALGRRFGQEERAVQVNGLEVAYHDPRGASGMALVYATSPRGACHNQSDYFLVDIGQVETDIGLEFFPRQAGPEKSANVALHQDWRTIFNALVICFFANVPPQTVVDLINTACGLDWDIAEMMRAGERAWNLKRVINNRLGVNKSNDRIPKPLLEPLPDGGAAGYVIDIDAMLERYYQVRGWDPVTGYPSSQTLKRLDLDWAHSDITKDS
jgi:aldehyde:ferredoxin oxidoreductase